MGIIKSVAPGQDWTGESGSWLSSSRFDSIANAAKNSSGDNVVHLMRMKEQSMPMPMPMPTPTGMYPINSRQ